MDRRRHADRQRHCRSRGTRRHAKIPNLTSPTIMKRQLHHGAVFAEPLQLAIRTGTTLSCSSTDITAAVPASPGEHQICRDPWRWPTPQPTGVRRLHEENAPMLWARISTRSPVANGPCCCNPTTRPARRPCSPKPSALPGARAAPPACRRCQPCALSAACTMGRRAAVVFAETVHFHLC